MRVFVHFCFSSRDNMNQSLKILYKWGQGALLEREDQNKLDGALNWMQSVSLRAAARLWSVILTV